MSGVSVRVRGSAECVAAGVGNMVVAGVGNVVVAGAPAGRCVVVGDGGRAETVVVPRGLRNRIERWAKEKRMPFAVAVGRLAAVGLAAEARK
jgi:hypothetical protein